MREMVYVCHKVGVTFPFCTLCETYQDCEREAEKRREALDNTIETQETVIELTA